MALISQKRKYAPKTIVSEKKASFIAANGFSGFRSRYDTVYDSQKFTHIYVIKGGPGTGKSRLMAEAAEAAEKAGATTEYIYCSSDPHSLDGIICKIGDRSVAMLDGTAPHVRCTDTPGAIDEIIDLGAFWDSARLGQNREKISALSEQKSNCYKRAYLYLALAGGFDKAREKLLEKCLCKEKMKKAVIREFKHLTATKHPTEDLRYLSAFSMAGPVRLFYTPKGTRIININDIFGSARFYLSVLRDELRAAKMYTYCLYPSCFSDDIPEAIYLPQNNTLFLADSDEWHDRCINMKRFFVQKKIIENRSELRMLDAMRDKMLTSAEAALRMAGDAHFSLEKIYGETMDFSAKESFSREKIEKFVSYLHNES